MPASTRRRNSLRPRKPSLHTVAAVTEKPEKKGKRKREVETAKMGKTKALSKKKTPVKRQKVFKSKPQKSTKKATQKKETGEDSQEESDDAPNDTLHESRLLLLGLDAAGKTTILYWLKLGEVITTIPTIGFNVENIEYRKCSMTMWDVGGTKNIRSLWRHYYQNTDALIFVVDSADRGRLEEAAEEMHKILADDSMKDVAILVYANKMDLPGAMSLEEIKGGLKLHEETQRKWYMPCFAYILRLSTCTYSVWFSLL